MYSCRTKPLVSAISDFCFKFHTLSFEIWEINQGQPQSKQTLHLTADYFSLQKALWARWPERNADTKVVLWFCIFSSECAVSFNFQAQWEENMMYLLGLSFYAKGRIQFVTAVISKGELKTCNLEMCQVSAVSSGFLQSSCPDFMLFCRFQYGPTECWNRPRWSPPANHPLAYGSGERYVCKCISH